MNREQKAVLAVSLVLGVVILALLGGTYYMWHDYAMPKAGTSSSVVVPSGTSLSEAAVLPFYLYFYDAEHDSLLRQSAVLSMAWKPENLPQLAAQAVGQLLQPPASGAVVSAIPQGTRIETIFYEEPRRLVYVNLSEEYFVNHPGGVLEGWASLYALVNTLCSLSPSIEQVMILRQGHVLREGPGGWDYSRPYRPDETLVRIPRAETTG